LIIKTFYATNLILSPAIFYHSIIPFYKVFFPVFFLRRHSFFDGLTGSQNPRKRSAPPNVLKPTININSLVRAVRDFSTEPFLRRRIFGKTSFLIVWFVDILLLYWCVLIKSAAFCLMDCSCGLAHL